MLRLYRAPFSTNVERVALALGFKGLEVESVVISYDDRSPVVAVSGQGLGPVLGDAGGGLLRVVVAGEEVSPDPTHTLRPLEAKGPAPPLFPNEAARRAELDVFF